MTPIGHVMILASAGSGKTYALTNRFVRLLALGAKPERIVALTFTRKAAGEFFDRILGKLAEAARDPGIAAKLAGEIELPMLREADFLKLLRGVTDAIHRLRLGTLDGFFARVARNFPLELGLTGQFEILQEHAARMERGRVLRRMFARRGDLADAQKEFVEAFRQATFGADEKRLGTQLDQFIDQHQEIFLAAPEHDLWGNAGRIWPQGSVWPGGAEGRTSAALELRQELVGIGLTDTQRARWEDFFTDLAAWSPGAPMNAALKYIFTNALKCWPVLDKIMVERKTHPLPPAAGEALRQVVRAIIGGELAQKIEVTRGIYAVLSGYENDYDVTVRRTGKLTFGDVQRLLLPGAAGGRELTGEEADERRMFLDYRLDGETDHWLLDEFQDTSFGQWSVLRNLIDEAVQDPTGARSFFYVGDVKQAIYAWRGGDPGLFREIFDHYNSGQQGRIAEKHLVKSFRSGPPVIGMINAVFGAADVITGLFPGEGSATWKREWRDHLSAQPQLGGQVAWLHAEDEEARFATALRILHEIAPLERGLTCAVLVRKNGTAAELAEYLRREGGLPAIAESDLHVCTDNPLGAALLAMVKMAAHPGDGLAREFVLMTPLGALLAAEGLTVPEALTRTVLGQIHAEGFEPTVGRWAGRLTAGLAVDDIFSRERAGQFVAAAGMFDATESRNVAEFIEFMERYTVRDTEAAAGVRVMTIHKAKGLDFDMVILPDLEGTKLTGRREGLGVQRASNRSIEWILDLPGKLVIEQDAALSAHLQAAEAHACYENLSLLYVAMTRAKRSMYLITKNPGKSESLNFPRLLAATLGEKSATVRVGKLKLEGGWVDGDAEWHNRVAPFMAVVRQPGLAVTKLDLDHAGLCRRFVARRPSGPQTGICSAEQIFAWDGNDDAVDFGNSVHQLLAQVEWASGASGLLAGWKARGAAGKQALACLVAPALANVWAAPGERAAAEVWRERAFEIILDGTWVTGVFDRVVVYHDAAGQAISATVFDFKTDRVADESDLANALARYAPQLNLYRRVAAVLANLDEKVVACAMVLTRTQQSIAVSQS